MKLLAIETSTPASSVAIGRDGALTAMNVHVDRRGHIGFLVPALAFVFDRAGWDPADVDVVAVDLGPGPFTGLRAGVATAQAFAAAVGARLVGVDSLSVLALRAATGRRRIWPVVDMRRGQIATAPFRPLPGGIAPDGPTEVVSPEEFRATLECEPTDTLVVGDLRALPDGFWSGLHRVKRGRPRFPSADVILEIAALRAERGEFISPEDLHPRYLREPDVAINWSEFRSEGLWP